jgi:hypothetical protein
VSAPSWASVGFDGVPDTFFSSFSAAYDVKHFLSWNRVATKAKEVPENGEEEMQVDEETEGDPMSARSIFTHDLLLYGGSDRCVLG